jgi:ABC-type branched-subunit amino acid transport system ATPase component/branched-subunit amino acid ABC-type transport system permease component
MPGEVSPTPDSGVAPSAMARLNSVGQTKWGKITAASVGTLAILTVLGKVLPHGLPAGTVALGLIYGSFSALTAAGLVLIYRASRVISFAQASIGGLGAAVALIMVTVGHVSYFLAVPVALLVAIATGILVDQTVVRRFRKAPRMLVTVATIGVGQIVAALQIFIPHLAGVGLFTPFTTPFGSWRFNIGHTSLTGDDVVAIGAAVVVLAALGWFLGRTSVGIAIRAAADSEERAVLLGIPVRLLSSIAWGVAAGLAGLAALVAQPIENTNLAVAVDPSALVIPLTAAIVARFSSIPVAVLSALGLGVLDQTVLQTFPIGGQPKADVAVFVVVLLALMIQRRRSSRSGEAFGTEIFGPMARRVPKALRGLPEYQLTRLVGIVTLLAVVAFVVPIAFNRTQIFEAATAAILGIIAVSLVPLSGWAGQISLGQFAIAAGGACATGSLLAHFNVDLFVALGVSVLVGAAIATMIGLPALRQPGMLLAAGTMVFAVPVNSYFTNSLFFPSITPTVVTRPTLLGRVSIDSPWVFYGFCLVLLILVMHLTANFRNSRAGRVVLATRDNEHAASAFSISPLRTKLVPFAFSGALAGLAGGLYVLLQGGIPSLGFDPTLSLSIFVMVVIGGLGSTTGALLGVAYVQFVGYLLTGTAQLLATGVGFLALLMIFPGGLAQVVYSIRDRGLGMLARKRGMETAGIWERAHFDPVEDTTEVVAEQPEHATKPTSQGLLSLDQVDAGYGGMQVLFGTSVGVDTGEILALLGTNGAGKSTVLRIVSGLLGAKRGRVTFEGQDVTAMSPLERVKSGVVMVPAGRAVFGSLTVAENLSVASWRARRDGRDAQRGIDECLALFPALQRVWNSKAAALSGGEQQMLTIAQALLCAPRMLLIDELSLGLSPLVVGQLLATLRELRARGVTIVIVEQSVNVAAEISDRAVFMERGQVRFSGLLSHLVERDDLLRAIFLSDDSASPRGVGAISVNRAKQVRDRRVPGVSVDEIDTPSFTATNIRKHFGGVVSVDDVSIEVCSGEILGIIGSNGAGKTTLFDICSGFLAPDSGRLHLSGHDITNVPAWERAARGLGRIFQDAKLFPTLTVSEVVAIALERHIEVRDPLVCIVGTGAVRRSEQQTQRRVDELLELLNLSRYRDSFIRELSTGTRRIVEVACAMAHSPQVLLLDEPSSGIAQREVEALATVLRELQTETQMTMIIIEHDIPLIRGISDRLLCMHMGRVLSEGTPASVLTDPAVLESYLGNDPAVAERSGPRRNPVLTGRLDPLGAASVGRENPSALEEKHSPVLEEL